MVSSWWGLVLLVCSGCAMTGDLRSIDIDDHRDGFSAGDDAERSNPDGRVSWADAESSEPDAQLLQDAEGLAPDAQRLAPDAAVGPVCGDGTCEGGEGCADCPADCGACGPVCGDGRCDGGETCGKCAADCGDCGWPEGLARSEEALFQMVNAQRMIGGDCGGVMVAPSGPLRMNAELRQAARLHSQDMADNNYFDHRGLDGSNFSIRASRANYRGFAAGENIAAGNATAETSFRQWMNSPGHCQNMLRARFTEIGVGHAEGDGQYRHYWTQVFGG